MEYRIIIEWENKPELWIMHFDERFVKSVTDAIAEGRTIEIPIKRHGKGICPDKYMLPYEHYCDALILIERVDDDIT